MVHRPFKTPSLRAVLLALAAMPFMAIQTRAQEPPPTAPGQFDPSDVYFQGYLASRAAEQLEAQGDFVGAEEKLEQARKLFEGVVKYYPDWKKDMVGGRFEKTVETIAKVKPKADEQRRKNEIAISDLEGANVKGKLTEPTDPTPNILEADPLAARRLAEAEAEVARVRKLMGNTAPPATATPRNPNEASRDASRVGDLERQRDALAAQLRAAETNVESLRARLTTSPMEKEYKALNQRIEGLEQEREGMARALAQSRNAHADALARNATLEADLSNTRKQIEELRQNESNLARDLKKERGVANEVVAGMRRQMDSLEKSLKDKSNDLHKANERIAGLEVELSQSRDAFADLRTQRDALVLERDQMANLLKLNEAGRITQLIEQNMGLAKDLREANEKVERLNVDGNAAKDEVIERLRDLAMAKSKINELQREKRDQAKRVTELENRLKGEEGALARGEASSDPAEVEVLRDIIKRQLRVQERQRQARDLMVQAAKELGSKDESMASAIELFDGQEVVLTPEEQKLLADRKVDGEFISPFARDRGLVEGATQGLKSELQSYDRAATKAFAAGRFHPTRELYQMIVEANPGDSSALCKLGVVHLRLKDPTSAANVFRRATELDGNNPYAHRMLGLSLLDMSDLSGAEESVNRSVQLAPENAAGQSLLGGIQFYLSKYKEAEEHFKAAIAADPIPSDPYFNLAQLHVKTKRFEEARNYYNLALERGAVPDVRLEKLLSQ